MAGGNCGKPRFNDIQWQGEQGDMGDMDTIPHRPNDTAQSKHPSKIPCPCPLHTELLTHGFVDKSHCLTSNISSNQPINPPAQATNKPKQSKIHHQPRPAFLSTITISSKTEATTQIFTIINVSFHCELWHVVLQNNLAPSSENVKSYIK